MLKIKFLHLTQMYVKDASGIFSRILYHKQMQNYRVIKKGL